MRWKTSRPDGSDGDAQARPRALASCCACLYPATPHITHACGGAGLCRPVWRLLDAPWPRVDEAALVQDEIELMLQVNGKLRGSIRVPAKASKEEIEAVALSSEAFLNQATQGAIKRVILVPGRLVNVVV
jgi:leucyl-tRNA synthetase